LVDQQKNSYKSKTPNPRILVVANQKGGVGKTTTAVNLGTAMAACELQVLLIDLDPQGNASTGLGIPRSERDYDSYAVLSGEVSMTAAIMPSTVPGLYVVPSSQNLSGAEIELVSIDKREYRLREALVRHIETEQQLFDFIIIDCPPSLGLLTLNAFVAADAVLVPLQCEFYALEGLSMLLKTIERVQKAFNPALELQGIVLTMADKRNNLSEQVAADVRAHLGAKVYNTVIPRNVRVSEAPSHGLPALVYDLQCAGSQAYIHLATEVIKRERSYAHD
jgi:chromosome partitioning protein